MSEFGPLPIDRSGADHEFRVDAPFDLAGDQPEAIEALACGSREDADVQALFGVIGSGKTSTVSWVVEGIQKPTLVLTHSKTFTARLYGEFKGLFPDNAVEYFVSYYDYYQSGACIEQIDTCVDKDMPIDEEIDRLRRSVTRSLLTRDDVTVVASAPAIYSLDDPKNYTGMFLRLEIGQGTDRGELLRALVDLNYERNDVNSRRGTFRVRDDIVEVFPMYDHYAVRIEFWGDEIDRMLKLGPLEGKVKSPEPTMPVHPAEHYSISEEQPGDAISEIEKLMEQRVKYF